MSVLTDYAGTVEPDRPEDCACPEQETLEGVELISCWPCARDGFSTINPNPPEEDDE